LPPNWKKAVAPSGEFYYYHRVTRETQWEFPSQKAGIVARTHAKRPWEEESKVGMRKISPVYTIGRSSSTSTPKPHPEENDMFQRQINYFITSLLSSSCQSQFLSEAAMESTANRLTNLIYQREVSLVGRQTTGHDVKLDLRLTPEKRTKIKNYIARYLQDHGFRIDIKLFLNNAN